MTPLFKKLNLTDQKEIVVLDAPGSFEPELAALDEIRIVRAAAKAKEIEFAIAFVKTLEDVKRAATAILPKASSDAVLWFAYPKGTSKKYRCEFNRDNGWDALGHAGFEGVRMVAIDEDWSALRFRRVEHIKTLTRDPRNARSTAGKQRASKT